MKNIDPNNSRQGSIGIKMRSTSIMMVAATKHEEGDVKLKTLMSLKSK